MATTYVNKNNPNLTLTPNDQDLQTRQGGMSDITFLERLTNSGYVPMNQGGQNTNNLPTTQPKLNISSNTEQNTGYGWYMGDKPADFTSGQSGQMEYPASRPNVLTSDFYNEYIGRQNEGLSKMQAETDALKASLKTRADEDVARIRDEYTRREQELKRSQEGENKTWGATNFRLGRTGTYYGDEETQKLNERHNQQLNALNNERETLIQGVRRALENNNVELAGKMMQEANRVSDTIFNTQRQQRADQVQAAQQALAFAKEQRQYNKDLRQEAEDEIKRMAGSGIPLEQIDPDRINYLEKKAGFSPGTFEAYYDTTFSANQIKNQEDLFATQEKIVNLLSKIPEGQTIRIGGNEYNGMKEIDPKKGIYSFTETDGRGNVTQVLTRLNEQTGKPEVVGRLELGQIGKGFKGSSGGSGGGGNVVVNKNNLDQKTIDKLIKNYPQEFKSYIQSIASEVTFELNNQSVGQLYQQFKDLKSRDILPFGEKPKKKDEDEENLF